MRKRSVVRTFFAVAIVALAGCSGQNQASITPSAGTISAAPSSSSNVTPTVASKKNASTSVTGVVSSARIDFTLKHIVGTRSLSQALATADATTDVCGPTEQCVIQGQTYANQYYQATCLDGTTNCDPGPWTLSVPLPPPGATGSFSPNPVGLYQHSILSLATSEATTPGIYKIGVYFAGPPLYPTNLNSNLSLHVLCSLHFQTCKLCAPVPPGPDPYARIPLIDSTVNGSQVTNYAGELVTRPDDGRDPRFFINQGLLDTPMDTPAGFVLFVRHEAWDEQTNHGPVFDNNAIDYATIVIGLYGAATRTPIDRLLELQNLYQRRSNYAHPKLILFDSKYTNLPSRNVFNTQLGYQLYARGAFKCP